MGFFSHLWMVMRAKSNRALNRAENPLEMLEYADDQQRELLRRVKQGIIEVAISKRQLQQHVASLEKRIPSLEKQAIDATGLDREDLARIALERKQAAHSELDRLMTQVREVDQEEQKLVTAEQRLASRIDEFKIRRQTLSARFSAAEAQTMVKESLTNVSGEFAELSMAVGRAEEKVEYMIARASAMDDLIESDGIASLTYTNVDVVERELAEIEARAVIERDLKQLQASTPVEEKASGDAVARG
jgi:phage shock protein A